MITKQIISSGSSVGKEKRLCTIAASTQTAQKVALWCLGLPESENEAFAQKLKKMLQMKKIAVEVFYAPPKNASWYDMYPVLRKSAPAETDEEPRKRSLLQIMQKSPRFDTNIIVLPTGRMRDMVYEVSRDLIDYHDRKLEAILPLSSTDVVVVQGDALITKNK